MSGDIDLGTGKQIREHLIARAGRTAALIARSGVALSDPPSAEELSRSAQTLINQL